MPPTNGTKDSTTMNKLPLILLAIGTIMLTIHLFQKLVTGFGFADASDAMAIMLLAIASKVILLGRNQEA